MTRPGPQVIVTVVKERDPLELFKAGALRWFGRENPPRIRSCAREMAAAGMSDSASIQWHQEDFRGFNPGRSRQQQVRIEWRD